jgi:hypothetical protein
MEQITDSFKKIVTLAGLLCLTGGIMVACGLMHLPKQIMVGGMLPGDFIAVNLIFSC